MNRLQEKPGPNVPCQCKQPWQESHYPETRKPLGPKALQSPEAEEFCTESIAASTMKVSLGSKGVDLVFGVLGLGQVGFRVEGRVLG